LWVLVKLVVLLAAAQLGGRHRAHAAQPVLNGQVQYETFGYPDPDAQSPRWENFFAAVVRGRGGAGPTLTYQFEGRAVADDVGFTAGAYSLRNATRRRPYLSLISAVLDYRPLAGLSVSVGKQIVDWSGIDEIQPANLMTPRDESDIFRRVKLGIPAVSARYDVGRMFAELAVVPLAFTPSRLPQGRWNIIGGGVEELQDLPPVRLNETQAGARAGVRLGALEASLIGYVGRDTCAIFVPNLVYVGGDQIFKLQIIDHYPHMRAGGVTGSYAVGERTLLRLESVYFNSPDRDREDFLQTVGGAEVDLDDWRLVFNYLHYDMTVPAPQEVTDKGERSFFHSFLFGELRYDAGGKLLGRLRGGYDVTEDFLLLQPEVSYGLWGGLRVALVGDVIDAHRRSYFDSIRHEDRLGTRLEYHY
jgi:hypothetical protein